MAFIGIPGDGSHVYVGVDKREDFDKISARCHDHGVGERGGHVLTKTVKSRSCQVIFQFWLKNPTIARKAEA